MTRYNLIDVKAKLQNSKQYWISFVEKEDLEAGVLYLEPGKEDVQSPHNTDEIYFIIEGDGFLSIDGEDHPVGPHTAFYVPKKTPHKFHGNTIPVVAYYSLN